MPWEIEPEPLDSKDDRIFPTKYKFITEEEVGLYGLADCFCGAKEEEGEIDLQEYEEGVDWQRYLIVCFKCGARGVASGNKAVAVEHWNRGGRGTKRDPSFGLKDVKITTLQGDDFILDVAKQTGRFVAGNTTT